MWKISLEIQKLYVCGRVNMCPVTADRVSDLYLISGFLSDPVRSHNTERVILIMTSHAGHFIIFIFVLICPVFSSNTNRQEVVGGV